jgi:uncharacterized protein YhfF
MKSPENSVKIMWKMYLERIGENPDNTGLKYTSWHFCDNREDADELVQLAKIGTKRATASLFMLYEFEGERVPEAGDISILTDWDGNAQCVIKNERVSILPFKDITEDHAAIEGEGDKSLEYWRRAHRGIFEMDAESAGEVFNEDMLVVFEEFEVVFK